MSDLFKAIINSDIDTIKLLLSEEGVNINAQDKDGSTALHEAARKGNQDIVELLIDKGAGINIRDADGCTALHQAVRKHNQNIVELLIDRGASINILDVLGRNALYYAAQLGNHSIARLLIITEIRIKDINDDTPLHAAVYSGSYNTVELFLDKKSVNIQNKYGRTPLHAAVDLSSRHPVRGKKVIELMLSIEGIILKTNVVIPH